MRVIAWRTSLLAYALAAVGVWLSAAPLFWLGLACALVGLASMVAALLGVTP